MELFLPERKPVDEKHAKMWAKRRKKSLLKYRGIEPTEENVRKFEKSEPKLRVISSR